MKLISHRGNINGKILDLENNPNYIDSAIEQGYDVEIDLWFKDHTFFLGHDEPQYEVDLNWLTNRHLKLWVHCKDLQTLSYMWHLKHSMLVNLNYFFHNTDDATLTSKGYLWVYPGKQPVKNSISVLPELNNDNVSQSYGICSDYIKNYR